MGLEDESELTGVAGGSRPVLRLRAYRVGRGDRLVVEEDDRGPDLRRVVVPRRQDRFHDLHKSRRRLLDREANRGVGQVGGGRELDKWWGGRLHDGKIIGQPDARFVDERDREILGARGVRGCTRLGRDSRVGCSRRPVRPRRPGGVGEERGEGRRGRLRATESVMYSAGDSCLPVWRAKNADDIGMEGERERGWRERTRAERKCRRRRGEDWARRHWTCRN